MDTSPTSSMLCHLIFFQHTLVYATLIFCHAVQPNPSNTLAQQTGLATSSSPGSDYGNGTQAPYSIIVSTNGYD